MRACVVVGVRSVGTVSLETSCVMIQLMDIQERHDANGPVQGPTAVAAAIFQQQLHRPRVARLRREVQCRHPLRLRGGSDRVHVCPRSQQHLHTGAHAAVSVRTSSFSMPPPPQF